MVKTNLADMHRLVAGAAQEDGNLHARALEYLERYTAIPYAFGKFDFVLIPAFQFGGMEHAGKVLYDASVLMLDESATQASLEYLAASLPEIDLALTRGSAWVTLWDAVLDGRLRPDVLMDLSLRALPREPDEQMRSRILGYASTTWWRFLNQSQRDSRAAGFESLLRAGLEAAGTPSQKAAWFGTLRDVAMTPGTVAWLRQVCEKKAVVTGLPLAEDDYSALAQELAVRQVEGWKDVLATQLARIENPDRNAADIVNR